MMVTFQKTIIDEYVENVKSQFFLTIVHFFLVSNAKNHQPYFISEVVCASLW